MRIQTDFLGLIKRSKFWSSPSQTCNNSCKAVTDGDSKTMSSAYMIILTQTDLQCINIQGVYVQQLLLRCQHIPQTSMAIARHPAGFLVSTERNMILLNSISHMWNIWQTSLLAIAKCLPVVKRSINVQNKPKWFMRSKALEISTAHRFTVLPCAV